MNPATVSLEKAGALLDLGVNRISMGVQSWDETLLKTLGRVHNAAQARRSYEILREAGVPNVNLDLIFGVPGQTRAQWRDSLAQTIALGPDHISAYCLTYEEDTEFFLRLQRGEMRPDEGLDADLFEMTMDALGEAGYAQYEISNYARPGRECRHNLAYWNAADYVGLGPSAFSTVGESRWKNVSDTEEYVRRINAGQDAADFRETVDARTRRGEQLAFALRTSGGIDPDEEWSGELKNLEAAGYIEPSGRGWMLTRAGKMVADAIAEKFV
jgi:oxygen-independent coproporphyrinogen-3 oxidase